MSAVQLTGRVERAGFTLDVDVEAHAGEVIAVIGPNGSGKTTLLDTLAGFAHLCTGRLVIDGTTWDDGARHVPPRRRRVGVMTARGDLFPHLDARRNVAFGLRARGATRRQAHERADVELAAVGLAGLERRRPHELSSGQAQRVALARALALEPSVLLLDEPLSAVDVDGAQQLRGLLAQRLRGSAAVTFVVTHDPIEALTLANRIIVLEAGSIVQQGTPAHLVAQPRSAFAARLVGLNVWRGRLDGTSLTTPGGGRIVAATPAPDDGPAPVLEDGERPSTAAARSGGAASDGFAAFAPNACSLWLERPVGSPRNTWRVEVERVEHVGTTARVSCRGEADLVVDVTLDAVAALGLRVGRQVHATVKATDVTLYR